MYIDDYMGRHYHKKVWKTIENREDCLTCKYYKAADLFSGATCDMKRYAFPSLIREIGCKQYVKK